MFAQWFTFRSLLKLAMLCLIGLGAASRAETIVTYPAPESSKDTRYGDLIELLKIALQKTVKEYGPYRLQPSALPMNEARYLLELKTGRSINVAWSSTSVEKEHDYLPIRIPLRKGLLGYRIALINRNLQQKADQIGSIEDLRKMSLGQGIGWGDTRVYAANGISVRTAAYEDLFYLTAQNRVQLFPRGINEVYVEMAARQAAFPDLMIEPKLLIYYPWPYYFFFHQQDHALAERIETGLRKMLRDGSFDQLFWQHNHAAIEQAHLQDRRLIRLNNPFLPKETPLDDASLWFDPENFKSAK